MRGNDHAHFYSSKLPVSLTPGLHWSGAADPLPFMKGKGLAAPD